MSLESEIQKLRADLDYLSKLVQRHNHDGVETIQLDIAISGLSSPLTTKGDLWGYDSADNRIPVGADGKVLTADSSKALGVDWKTPSSSSFVSPLTTRGDIHVFSTVDDRLSVGSDGQTLYADSFEPSGLRWGSPGAIGLTTKGDLLTFSSSIDRLPVGSNGQILSADSAESTGLKWINLITTGFTSRVRAYLGADQNLAVTGFEKILFDSENFDGDSEFDTSNNNFTAAEAGTYLIICRVQTNRTTDTANDNIAVFKNGSATDLVEFFTPRSATGSYTPSAKIVDQIELSAGDVIDVRVNVGSYSTPKVLSGGGATFLSIHRLS